MELESEADRIYFITIIDILAIIHYLLYLPARSSVSAQR